MKNNFFILSLFTLTSLFSSPFVFANIDYVKNNSAPKVKKDFLNNPKQTFTQLESALGTLLDELAKLSGASKQNTSLNCLVSVLPKFKAVEDLFTKNKKTETKYTKDFSGRNFKADKAKAESLKKIVQGVCFFERALSKFDSVAVDHEDYKKKTTEDKKLYIREMQSFLIEMQKHKTPIPFREKDANIPTIFEELRGDNQSGTKVLYKEIENYVKLFTLVLIEELKEENEQSFKNQNEDLRKAVLKIAKEKADLLIDQLERRKHCDSGFGTVKDNYEDEVKKKLGKEDDLSDEEMETYCALSEVSEGWSTEEVFYENFIGGGIYNLIGTEALSNETLESKVYSLGESFQEAEISTTIKFLTNITNGLNISAVDNGNNGISDSLENIYAILVEETLAARVLKKFEGIHSDLGVLGLINEFVITQNQTAFLNKTYVEALIP